MLVSTELLNYKDSTGITRFCHRPEKHPSGPVNGTAFFSAIIWFSILYKDREPDRPRSRHSSHPSILFTSSNSYSSSFIL
jgi:hypothetical protein